MIIRHGDIFTSEADALVNPVNCVGVMGKGLALEFKKRFPDNFVYYKATYDRGLLEPGIPSFFNENGLWIINFPTKKHWRSPSKIEWIEDGLYNISRPLSIYNIKSVALPMLGCGLGGLDENEVEKLIRGFSDAMPDIEVELWKN